MGDGQAGDPQIGTDAVDDQKRPAEIGDQGEGQVTSQVPQFHRWGHGGVSQPWQVAQDGASEQWKEHDRPVRKRLSGQVRQNDFGGHAAKNERHGDTEENQPVVPHEARMGRIEPGTNGSDEDRNRRPLQKYRGDREALCSACFDHVIDTGWKMSHEEREENNGYPMVNH